MNIDKQVGGVAIESTQLLSCSCDGKISLLAGETSAPGNYAGSNPQEYRYRCMGCGAEGPSRGSAEGAADGWNMIRSMLTNAPADLPAVADTARRDVGGAQ